ncbi:hypothetical protein MMC28_010830 [Mycoblastus sanguinarius]|nr:hypothetical protein [Mycoblastus sanguinarius]
MSWMAGRKTKRVEDVAYSIVGIFNIRDMEIHYGEGKGAFVRLQKKIMENFNDESIFAWTTPLGRLPHHKDMKSWAPNSWGLLAPSPECFSNSGDIMIHKDKIKPKPIDSIKPVQQWVQFPVPIGGLIGRLAPISGGSTAAGMFGAFSKKLTITLNCWKYDGRGRPRPIKIELAKHADGWHRHECEC